MGGSREQFDDPRMERLQNRLLELERFIDKIPFLRGARVPSKAIDIVSTRVAHRLGRKPTGFLVLVSLVNPPAAVGLYPGGTIDGTFIDLVATNPVICDLWFF